MMLRKGLGIAFLQKTMVSDELASHKLIELPLSEPMPLTPVYLTIRSDLPEKFKQAIVQTSKFIFQSYDDNSLEQ